MTQDEHNTVFATLDAVRDIKDVVVAERTEGKAFRTDAEARLADLEAKVDQIAAGNIDYGALAKAVNDDAAKRLQS